MRVHDSDLERFARLNNPTGDMARELELARKVIALVRAFNRKHPHLEGISLREYDAGETSEAQPEPRKPSFAAAADAIIRREYAPRAVGVTWAGILDVIERARRASGE